LGQIPIGRVGQFSISADRLGSKAPLEMLGTRVEAQAVIDHLGRLENGVAV
jgi:uncharacterized protein (DUF2384 family)